MLRVPRAALLVSLVALAGCGRWITTHFSQRPIPVQPLGPSGAVRVTEPEWFSATLPGPPRVGVRALATDVGPLYMKQLAATVPGLHAEIDYCAFEGPIRDREWLLDRIDDMLTKTEGARVVARERVGHGAWDGTALRLE